MRILNVRIERTLHKRELRQRIADLERENSKLRACQVLSKSSSICTQEGVLESNFSFLVDCRQPGDSVLGSPVALRSSLKKVNSSAEGRPGRKEDGDTETGSEEWDTKDNIDDSECSSASADPHLALEHHRSQSTKQAQQMGEQGAVPPALTSTGSGSTPLPYHPLTADVDALRREHAALQEENAALRAATSQATEALAVTRADLARTIKELEARCEEGAKRAVQAEGRVQATQGALFEAQGQLVAAQEGKAAAEKLGQELREELGKARAEEGWLSNYFREKGLIYNLENGKLIQLDMKKCKQRMDAGYIIDLVRMTFSRPSGVSKMTTDAE